MRERYRQGCGALRRSRKREVVAYPDDTAAQATVNGITNIVVEAIAVHTEVADDTDFRALCDTALSASATSTP